MLLESISVANGTKKEQNLRLQPLEYVVVPRYLYTALLSQNVNCIDFSDYEKMSKALSVDDLAEFLAYQELVRINGVPVSTQPAWGWNLFKINDTQLEQIKKLATCSNEIKNSVISYIKDESGFKGSDSFQFVKVDQIVYVIIEPGFLVQMSDMKTRARFLKSYVKVGYQVARLGDVNRVPMFKEYLRSLA